MIKKNFFLLAIFLFPFFNLFAEGQIENNNEFLRQGADFYDKGNLQEAADAFSKAAVSKDNKTAAVAYFNKGVVMAELAESLQDTKQKRQLLTESSQALMRSIEIGSLSMKQEKQAKQNIEIVRERLLKLPPEQEDAKEQQNQNEDQQKNDDKDSQGNTGSQEKSSSQDDMLKKQQNLSKKTSGGEGDTAQLAKEQQELQKQSEQAGMKEASENQQKAAEALKKGDRQEAAEHQQAAEKAITESMQKNNQMEQTTEEDAGMAEDILNQEAAREAEQNRLDKSGGIFDADRNW